ncbi:host cell division inhibitor Icd-like protein [Escherichia coli]|nr:host cell division inhibitor Icd-like protein [Escherichia coli]
MDGGANCSPRARSPCVNFAAVRRAERKPRISMLRIVASDESHARLSLVHEYVLCLAARLPVREVM